MLKDGYMSVENKDVVQNEVGVKADEDIKKCGIIMPISAMNQYSTDHWKEVKSIIVQATELVEEIDFKTEIVSNSEGKIDVIHKRIIQNIYNSDIVVCDISGRNPNVLFELGMRLTFDKPTVIIKDDITEFIFDTGVIEHVEYPMDLRYSDIVNFKEKLSNKIKKTYEAAKNDPDYSTFLGGFGEFKVPSINQSTVSDVNQLILDELTSMRSEINNFKKNTVNKQNYSPRRLIPPNLKEYIVEYIEKYNDRTEDAEIIIQKWEFNNFLKEKDIDSFQISTGILIKFINEAQDDGLPF